MTKPLDKILCHKKFYRYVVACMHNCPEPHLCSEFWKFFEAIGKSPVEYYNEDGIGEEVMRRVVFDCDRCGKKDLSDVFGLYSLEGEAEEHRLDDSQRAEAALKVGHSSPDVTRLAFVMLGEVEESRGWQHFCKKCFQEVTDGVARILNEKTSAQKRRRKKKPAARPEVAEPAADPTPAADQPADEPPAEEKPAAAKPARKGRGRTRKAAGAGLKL